MTQFNMLPPGDAVSFSLCFEMRKTYLMTNAEKKNHCQFQTDGGRYLNITRRLEKLAVYAWIKKQQPSILLLNFHLQVLSEQRSPPPACLDAEVLVANVV